MPNKNFKRNQNLSPLAIVIFSKGMLCGPLVFGKIFDLENGLLKDQLKLDSLDRVGIFNVGHLEALTELLEAFTVLEALTVQLLEYPTKIKNEKKS